MKQVSSEYKNQIKQMGREIDSIITYYNHYKMITENGHYILTENGVKINTEQINSSSYVEIGAEDTYSSKVITHGSLLKTMMREFDFEVRQEMNIGSIVNYKFGLKVNGTYEYIDLGNFIVQEKEYNEDTSTFSYKAYDMMLKSMIPYKDTATYPTTLYGLLNSVLEYCGIEIGVSEFPNSERDIYDNPFSSMDITCRDALDFITEVTGCSSYIQDGTFIINGPSDTNLTLYADSFKDTNVKFSKVYGPINSILFSRSEDLDIIEIKDDASIEENGVTQIKIKDNPLLEDNDRSDYFEEMFGVLDGLTYSINDLSSVGITYLDYMDLFDVNIGDNTYNCLLLNDEINVEQGLEENIFTNEIEETEKEYMTSTLSDKEQKWANIYVKKEVGEISLEVGDKVGKNEVISSINLSPEDAVIKSSKIKLEGYTTINNGFSVDNSGNMSCNNANVTNATINNATINNATITTINNTNNPSIALKSSSNVSSYRGTYIRPCNMELVSYIQSGTETSIEPSINLYWDYLGVNTFIGANGCFSPEFTQTSLESEKKNFEKFDSGLDIIKNIEIYKYHLKSDRNNDKKRYGFVIGDNYKYSKELTDKNNKGVNLYSFISICCKAVQEQQEQIEKLQSEIEELKKKVE